MICRVCTALGYGRHDFGRYDQGGETIAKNTTQTKLDLDGIAQADNAFEETIKTADLVGKSFTINSVKTVSGQYGDSYVGEITLDGDLREAWLSGSVVTRQLDLISENDAFPYQVTLERDASKYGEPFVLRNV